MNKPMQPWLNRNTSGNPMGIINLHPEDLNWGPDNRHTARDVDLVDWLELKEGIALKPAILPLKQDILNFK